MCRGKNEGALVFMTHGEVQYTFYIFDLIFIQTVIRKKYFFEKVGKVLRVSPAFRSVDVEDHHGITFLSSVKKGCHLLKVEQGVTWRVPEEWGKF